MGSDVSTYGDVCSFGILLLEMFTGKRPTNNMFKDRLNLHNNAEMALPGRVLEVIEPILLREDVESSIHSSHRMNHIETRKTMEFFYFNYQDSSCLLCRVASREDGYWQCCG